MKNKNAEEIIRNATDLRTAIAMGFNLLKLNDSIENKSKNLKMKRNSISKNENGAEIIIYDEKNKYLLMIMWAKSKNFYKILQEHEKILLKHNENW